MAGFTPTDISRATTEEEPILKELISNAWATMKRTNWDDTKFCTINPKNVLTFAQAKSFKRFYDAEGWHVIIKKKERNYYFDIYQDLDFTNP